MKKLRFLMYLVLLLSAEGLLCQDLLDPPKLHVVDTSTAINRNRDFFLGWNWGSPGLKLDSALNINFYHNVPYNSTDIKHNLRSAEPVPNIVSSRGSNVILNAMSLQYEPTLDLDDYYTSGKFTPREGDTQGGVFGFVSRDMSIIDYIDLKQSFNPAFIFGSSIILKDEINDLLKQFGIAFILTEGPLLYLIKLGVSILYNIVASILNTFNSLVYDEIGRKLYFYDWKSKWFGAHPSINKSFEDGYVKGKTEIKLRKTAANNSTY